MSLKRVNPAEAAALVASGWTYVDIRSELEFGDGHPSGAFNVPFMHMTADGMVPNPDFEKAMAATFGKDARLLLGCKTGNRSQRACQVLGELGFSDLIDVRGGFLGELDTLGQVTCEGWQALGLPTSTTTEPGRSWNELKKRT